MKEQAQPDVLPDVDQVIQRCIDAVRDADCPLFATTAINDAVYTMRLMQDHITQLAQRERPALTDEQIREALIETDGVLRKQLGLPLNEPERIGLGINPTFITAFARAIERRAHGVGDPT